MRMNGQRVLLHMELHLLHMYTQLLYRHSGHLNNQGTIAKAIFSKALHNRTTNTSGLAIKDASNNVVTALPWTENTPFSKDCLNFNSNAYVEIPSLRGMFTKYC